MIQKLAMDRQTAENIIHGITKGAAIASGAALGYIHNNWAGAFIGGNVGAKLADMKRKQIEATQSTWKKRKVGSKPYAPTGSKPSGKRSKRRSMKRKPVVKRKRGKRVTLRKSVKALVKGALKCDVPVGTYHKYYVQDLNLQNTTANNQLVYTNGQRHGVNNPETPYTSEGMSWCPFHLKKMLDAASVVFNAKAKAINWEKTDNNFSNPKILQLDVIYASYEITFKSIAQQDLKCKLIRAKAKKNIGEGVYDVWNTAIGNARWVGGAPNINTIGISPSGWKELEEKYAVKVEEFTMKTGEERTFKTVFKGCVDFQKHYVGDSLQSFGKGISESWNLVVIPSKTVYKDPEANDITATRGVTTGFYNYVNVEVKEVYKFYQPEITTDENSGQKFVYLTDFPAMPLGEDKSPVAAHVNMLNEYFTIGALTL